MSLIMQLRGERALTKQKLSDLHFAMVTEMGTLQLAANHITLRNNPERFQAAAVEASAKRLKELHDEWAKEAKKLEDLNKELGD